MGAPNSGGGNSGGGNSGGGNSGGGSSRRKRRSVRGGATKAAEKAITKKNNAATVLPDPPKANKKVSPKVTPAPKAPAPKVAKKATPKKVTLVEKPKAKAVPKASIAPTENKKATTAGKAAIKIKETKPANMGAVSDKENAEIDAAKTVKKVLDNSTLNLDKDKLKQTANNQPGGSLVKTALNSLPDSANTPKLTKVKIEKVKRATPKGGKPKAEQGTKSVLRKADEVLDLADTYEGKFQRDTLAKGLPEEVKAGIAKVKPKVSVLPQAPVKPTATEKAKQAMTSDVAYKLPAKETVHPMGSASAKSVSEKKVSPKITPPPKKAVVKPKATPVVDAGMDAREAAYQKPAPKPLVKDEPKITPPKVSLVAKPTGDPRNEPTAHQSTSAPKVTKPAPKVSLTTKPPANHPSQKEKAVLPKPTPAPKAKATPKGGKPMVEQKNITKGNNVATTAKEAADKRAEPAKKVSEDLDLTKKVFSDKYRNEDQPSYNQEYWATKLAEGKAAGNKDIQAELAAEQKKIGMKKAYSGDVVVTDDMKKKAADDLKRVTGSDATIQNGGVKVDTKKSGLLDENFETTYDYGKNNPKVTLKGSDPKVSILGKDYRLGDRKSTTYVDGVEVATKTGQDPLGYDAKVTRPDGIATHMDDQAKIEPIEAQNNLDSINDEIANTTDPAKLKSLYQRRLKLMRLLSTKTRHSNLLGLADTKRANLLGIL